MKRKIIFGLLTVLIVIQFFQPKKNASATPGNNGIENRSAASPEVMTILKTSCYDCHSNNTRYPWYSRVQPVGWWLNMHVKNAKEELNFEEFMSYDLKKQHHKLEEIEEVIVEKEMPLSSYTLIHRDAKLSDEQAALVVNWTKALRSEIEAKYPIENAANDSESEPND